MAIAAAADSRYTLELVGDSPAVLLSILDALGRMQDAEVVRGLLEEHSLLPDQREALLARELAGQLLSARE